MTGDDAVRARVREVLLELAPLKAAGIDGDTRLDADLGFDSLELVEATAVLEDEFGLPEVGDDDATGVETVADVEEVVLAKLGAKVGERG